MDPLSLSMRPIRAQKRGAFGQRTECGIRCKKFPLFEIFKLLMYEPFLLTWVSYA